MLDYAQHQPGDVNYVEGDAQRLPFNDNSFDYCIAITSLCFISHPAQVVAEMWRASRKGVLLGRLNRKSILYYQKHGKSAYQGARWDTCLAVNQWLDSLNIKPQDQACCSTIFMPRGSFVARQIENLAPGRFSVSGFLAVMLEKTLLKILNNTYTLSFINPLH
jgi:ubiquinone/menaquinone biosynthesis C-methylase UbiE